MDAVQIKSEVLNLIGDQFSFPKEKIKDNFGPGDLSSWDSIGHMQLVQKLESNFSISFSVFDIMEFNTVADICLTINRLLEVRI